MKKWLSLLLFVLGNIFLVPNAFAHHPDTANEQFIIINKKTNKLAFYDHGVLIKTFSVATGRSSKLTPEGTFKIIKLYRNMPYYAQNIPGGAPNNPLGDRWIGLDVPGTQGFTYGIHGTNAEWSIGTHASSGCVRMKNKDVRWLYNQLYYDATVYIVNSTKSFDQLAKDKGYQLLQPTPAEQEVILLQGTQAYANFHPGSPSTFIEAGTYHITKKAGTWFSITLNKQVKWIQTNAYATGVITKTNKTLLVEHEEDLYASPTTNSSSIGTLSTQYVHVFEQTTDGWLHILTSDYGDVWIHPTA